MRLSLICLVLLLSQYLPAQTITGFAGLGVSYDAFLPKPTVTPYSASWPFALGRQFVLGGKYYKGDGFGIIFDATLGTTSINLADAAGSLGVRYQQIQSLLMLGSGPQLKLRSEAIVMPYLQLGAGYFDYSSTSSSSSSYRYLSGVDQNTGRWCVLLGAGADWQLSSKKPLTLNLRMVYSPIDIFSDPVNYQSATGQQLQLQGKLLQTMLTLRVHLLLKKDNYY